ncbi:hypothetical protein D3C85_1514330 [compost metagenome]
MVTHGSTAIFSRYLNEIGIEAEEVKTQYGDEEAEESIEKVEKTEETQITK